MNAENYIPIVAQQSLESLRASEAELEAQIATERTQMLRLSKSITSKTLHLSEVKKAIGPAALLAAS
jgi:hypothetical protein